MWERSLGRLPSFSRVWSLSRIFMALTEEAVNVPSLLSGVVASGSVPD